MYREVLRVVYPAVFQVAVVVVCRAVAVADHPGHQGRWVVAGHQEVAVRPGHRDHREHQDRLLLPDHRGHPGHQGLRENRGYPIRQGHRVRRAGRGRV